MWASNLSSYSSNETVMKKGKLSSIKRNADKSDNTMTRRNSFSTNIDLSAEMSLSMGNSKHNHKFNKSSSYTGFSCLQDGGSDFKTVLPKQAWEDFDLTTDSQPKVKKVTLVLPKVRPRNKKIILNNDYFNQCANNSTSIEEKNKSDLFKKIQKYEVDRLPDNFLINELPKSTTNCCSRGKRSTFENGSIKHSSISTTWSIEDLPLAQEIIGTVENVADKKAELLNQVNPISHNECADAINTEYSKDVMQETADIGQSDTNSVQSQIIQESLPRESTLNDFTLVHDQLYSSGSQILMSKDNSENVYENENPGYHNENKILENQLEYTKSKFIPGNTYPLKKQQIPFYVQKSNYVRTQKPKITGYKPIGRRHFVTFSTMFSKTTRSGGNNTAIGDLKNDVSLNISVESLTPNDKKTIQTTRQILRKQIENVKENDIRNSMKIPLSIDISNKSFISHKNHDSDEDILNAIESKFNQNRITFPEPECRKYETHRPSSAPKVNLPTKTYVPLTNTAGLLKKHKTRAKLEINTQLSRASPVSSDVELLPEDILESKQSSKPSPIDYIACPSEPHPSTENKCAKQCFCTENAQFSSNFSDFDDILSYESDSSPTEGFTSQDHHFKIPNLHRYPLLVSESR